MTKVKKRLKKKFKIILYIIIILFFAIIFYPKKDKEEKIYINNISYINDKLEINLNYDNISCILSSSLPTLDDKWIKSNKKKCILDYIDNSNIYILSDNNIINMSNDINYIDINSDDIYYLAIGDKVKLINKIVGNKEKLNISINNQNIVEIDGEGYLNGLKNGSSDISIKYNDISKDIKVIVTDLITIKPKEFNHNKKDLPCNIYSKEDNDLLDEILKYKVNKVGYKTRAAAIEVARFINLEFPYKLNYFHENGRLTQNNKIDAEGRYYHIGLYLNESRFKDITKSSSSPKVWGCPIYSKPIKANDDNGLNCSGFVSWVLLNAGFDVKDIGAGITSVTDLTDKGDLLKLKDGVDTSKIKVGDLLHSNHTGGHIAIIVGIENDNYYAAQAIWEYAPISLTKRNIESHYVQITKYTKKELIKVFSEAVLMDKLYIEDGNLTNMWY